LRKTTRSESCLRATNFDRKKKGNVETLPYAFNAPIKS
jgi:hypothetical protein